MYVCVCVFVCLLDDKDHFGTVLFTAFSASLVETNESMLISWYESKAFYSPLWLWSQLRRISQVPSVLLFSHRTRTSAISNDKIFRSILSIICRMCLILAAMKA